jgi:hypothetical protein
MRSMTASAEQLGEAMAFFEVIMGVRECLSLGRSCGFVDFMCLFKGLSPLLS